MQARYETLWSHQPYTALNKADELFDPLNRAIVAIERVEKIASANATKKAIKTSIYDNKIIVILNLLSAIVFPYLIYDVLQTQDSRNKAQEVNNVIDACYDAYDVCVETNKFGVCWDIKEACTESYRRTEWELYQYQSTLYTQRLFGTWRQYRQSPDMDVIVTGIFIAALMILFICSTVVIACEFLHTRRYYKICDFPPLSYLTMAEEKNINDCLKYYNMDYLLIDGKSKNLVYHTSVIKDALIKIRDEIAVHVMLLNGQRSKQSSLFGFFKKGEGAAMDTVRTHVLPHLKFG